MIKPDYYIARETLESMIEDWEVIVREKKIDVHNDLLQALKELHEVTYGQKKSK